MCILDMVKIVADYFQLDASLIRSVSSDELNQPARRPPVTGFIIGKAERELGFRPRSFLEGLEVVKTAYNGWRIAGGSFLWPMRRSANRFRSSIPGRTISLSPDANERDRHPESDPAGGNAHTCIT